MKQPSKASLDNLKKFKKGQSGNPDGGRKHNPEMRKIKNLTQEELIEVGNMVIKGSTEEMRALVINPESNVLQAMVARVALRTISKGDPKALETLLCRLIGKVPDIVQLNSNNTNANVNVSVSKEDLRAVVKELEDDV
jgi:hypothetical protein